MSLSRGLPKKKQEASCDRLRELGSNEKGTEAAAATALIMAIESARMSPPDAKQFRADKPFVFVIRDTKTGAASFTGMVVNPNESREG